MFKAAKEGPAKVITANDLRSGLVVFLDPEGGWKGKVLGVKRKLPCLTCGGKRACTNCSGAGGFDRDCKICGGTISVKRSKSL